MKPVIPIYFSLCLSILLAACNPWTEWNKTIQNNSTHTLILYTTDGGGGFTFADSIILAPGASEVIFDFGDELNDAGPACEEYINRLTLVPEVGFTVTKDITDVNNWQESSNESDNGYEHNCLFTIADADIL